MTTTPAQSSATGAPTGERDAHLLRAEFYLCLARAFMAPTDPASCRAMIESLADDLEDLGNALGLDLAAPLSAYRESTASLAPEHSLLEIYSKLFLTPPAPVKINACLYLDGAVLGRACDELTAAYGSWGAEKREDFHDLPDHVSAQLEFAALAFATPRPPPGAMPATANEFLGRHVLPWVGPFVAALESAPLGDDTPNPYSCLARILARAVSRDAVLPPEAALTKIEAGLLAARHEWRERGLTPKDLEIIAKRLKDHGLAHEHVSTPCERRDAERGWERRRPR